MSYHGRDEWDQSHLFQIFNIIIFLNNIEFKFIANYSLLSCGLHLRVVERLFPLVFSGPSRVVASHQLLISLSTSDLSLVVDAVFGVYLLAFERQSWSLLTSNLVSLSFQGHEVKPIVDLVWFMSSHFQFLDYH